MQVIESAANEKVKHVAKLAKKSYRDEAGEFVIEGLRAVTDAQKCGANLLQVFMTEDLGLSFGEAQVFVVSEKAFLKMSQTENPQGVLAVAQMRRFSLADVLDKACVVFLDRVADPGNLGTIIRTARRGGRGGRGAFGRLRRHL